MVILHCDDYIFLISKDFLSILAVQNGYMIMSMWQEMCNTGVNWVESSMTKQNEVKPERAWDQTKKGTVDDI